MKNVDLRIITSVLLALLIWEFVSGPILARIPRGA